ncbi:G-type lectin S-receptor-like serine/threonine-protein kinase B120 isoform X2 [Bidens hawaiensis]|uniref:G-type lectin S-receptor-like serine/threonine-protein kinase B120 isoform X2 n=1 Tax=Bidens hawaiensis TaxID=980011 RepID=UPI00404B480D
MGFTSTTKTLTNLHIITFLILLNSTHVFPQPNSSRINQDQVLRDDNRTVVSPRQIFELGFFTPGSLNSSSSSISSSRYLGIWYYGIRDRTPVWVANRDNPIPDTSGVIRFENGSLILVSNQTSTVYWTSNTSNTGTGLNLTASLTDTGNFIISSVENAGDELNAIWRSCDHPTDTYLPNLRVYVNITQGIDRTFVSWRTPNDPSQGNYSMGIDPRGSPQVVVTDDVSNRRLWRTGHWNYQIFIGIPQMRSLLFFGFRLIQDNDGKMYFIFDNPVNSPLMRFMIQWNGAIQQLIYENQTGEWNVSLSQPSVGCEEYNKCGNFGICRTRDVPSICGCMNGFESNSRSGGCVRRTGLECSLNGSTSDGFVQRTGVKLPDFANLVSVGNGNDCENRCLRNCSCIAYAYVEGIGCLVWGDVLVDVEQFEQGGETLFIRVARSDLVSGSDDGVPKTTVIAVSVTCAVVLSVLALLLWRYRKKVKACRVPCGETKNGPPVTEVVNGQDVSMAVSEQLECERKNFDGAPLPVFSSSVLEAATDGYANKNKLGQGGFGPVHMGILPNGQEIAVKRLAKSSGQGLEEFKNEMILIAKLQHRNLVRLMGYCVEGEERMLVYEYMPNKSLDSFLFDPVKKAELDWKTRFKIIEGIARGLLYLHRDSRLRIIHRDLKVSNILLDEEMNPKISDFGMARIFGGNQNEANTNRVVGTYGYMSPEYAMEGLFSVKSDVYSFGVLLLEIITGHRNNSFRSEDSTNLIRHAWKLWKEGKPEELIDPLILDSCDKTEAMQCIHVAMLCVQSSAIQRPTMSSVVFMLEGENTSLPQPNEIDITSLSSAEMDLIMEGREINVSSNDVTITEVSGRL